MTINKDEWNIFQKFIYRTTFLIVSLKPVIHTRISSPFDLFTNQNTRGWVEHKLFSISMIKSPNEYDGVCCWSFDVTIWFIQIVYTSLFFSSAMSTLTKKKP